MYALTCAMAHEGRTLPIFPMLMPALWWRAEMNLCMPIIRHADRAGVPLVAPVHLHGDPRDPRRVFLRPQRLRDLGTSWTHVLQEAVLNLTIRPATWKRLPDSLATCTDDYLSAERILDPPFLRRAASLLGRPHDPLVVATPCRGTLIATLHETFTTRPRHARGFLDAIVQLFEEAGEHAISRLPLRIQDGRIVGIYGT